MINETELTKNNFQKAKKTRENKEHFKKAVAHIRYKNKTGKIVPGTTTIIGILAKPALLNWANRIGLEGYEIEKYKNEAADVGTLAHLIIEKELKQEKLDTSLYSSHNLTIAMQCVDKWHDWKKQHDFEIIMPEESLVSELYQYGGTIDCYCRLDGKLTLLDFKTSSVIYPEMFVQLAAYKQLLIENNNPVENTRILRIGRSEYEGFEDRQVTNLSLYWEMFIHCWEIYNLKKQLKF